MMRLTVFFLLCPPLLAQKYAQYESWLETDEPMIQVGLKNPEPVIKLSCSGPLLVLDGQKIVATIRPGGKFLLISGQHQRSGVTHWIQVRAAYNPKVLERTRTGLEGKYPNLGFSLVQATERLKALRVGPFDSAEEAAEVRKKMIAEGFSDAFPVRLGRSRFQWVDKYFDKYPLKPNNLGLVRTDPDMPIRYEDTPYRGILRFRLTGKRIQVINELPLETYLRGVVPSEMGPRVYPELEALKAQAVAARTYVLKNLGRFRKKGYDICDGPACQAYEGMKNEMALSDEAVAATKGMVLYHEDMLIDALYTSTSGGTTDDVGIVFPGRNEPYLKAKTEYLARFQSWRLPKRPIDREKLKNGHEHLAFLAVLYGFEHIPGFDGHMTRDDLEKAFQTLSWVLGPPPPVIGDSRVTYRAFWTAISKLSFFQESIAHQLQTQDIARLLRDFRPPEELGPFAALLLRYDFVNGEVFSNFDSAELMSKAEAFRLLFHLCHTLGPEPEWRRHRLEGLSNNRIQVRRGFKPDEIDLAKIDYYVTDEGETMLFREEPLVEELDRVYTLQPPFPDRILRIHQNGGVASVDRFSPFDFWIEKKDVETLERRARRYVSGIRGIRDIKIRKRAPTGRVELLEFITDAGNFKVDGLRIRWSLGIRDNLFDMLLNYRDGRVVHATFVGRGWGHGIGMSQVGAFGLARMGWTYDAILKYYYTDVDLRFYRPSP